MKYLSKSLLILAVLTMSAFVAVPRALAVTPTLSLSNNGGDNVTFSVNNADPNATISLSYMQSGSTLATTISNFGYTNYSGYFSTTASASSYGLNTGAQVYVTVNGQQSNIVTYNGYGYSGGGCGYYGCGTSSGVTFSQNNVTMTSGQTLGVTVYGNGSYGYNSFYVSSNSNSGVVSASISGSSLSLYAYSTGSSTIMVCQNTGSCGSLYVTVNGSGTCYAGSAYCGGGSLSLSQTSVTLSVGQSQTVTASGYSVGNLYISSNSNSGAVSASASGSQVYLNGLTAGSSTVTVCSNNSGYSGSNCGYIYVTVSGVLGANTNLWFSPASPTMYVGQSLAVSINSSSYSGAYAYSGNAYYVSGNSNSSVVSASVSGTVLNLYANQSGSSTVTICHSSLGFCGTLYVTVSGGGGVGGLTLSPSTVNISVGQSSTVNISYPVYNPSFYVSSNSNSSVATASVTGSQLYIYGQSTGSSTISVCASSGSVCTSAYVVVGGTGGGSISFSQSSVSLYVGQSVTVTAYNAPSVYISSNSNSSVATASVYNNSQLTIYGQSSGTTNIYVCGSSSSQCGYIYVTVGGGSVGGFTLNPSSVNVSTGQTATVTASFPYVYSGTLYVGSNSNSGVATVSFSGSTIYVYGQSAGSTTVSICYSSQCNNLYVTVNGYAGGGVTFSQNNISLNVGQSQTVTVYGNSSYGNNNFYISSNSSPTVVSATIPGNTLNLYGQNVGSTTLSICQYGGGCGSLYVTVGYGGYGGYGNLYFTTTTLPQPVVNQYYNQQLQVSGGSYPYNYSVISGSLPSGLTLTSGGQILGTPTSNIAQTFMVRVNDSAGRTATQSFTLTPSGGTVLGISTYPSGTLISENGTVYMVYKNTKSGFVSASVFRNLGFNFGQVMYVSNSGVPDSGYTISTAYASHPWGSWIKRGQTVYFVHDSGLIPVPNWDTFVNNNGNSNLIVSSNTYDFRLPILSVMVNGDSRLQ